MQIYVFIKMVLELLDNTIVGHNMQAFRGAMRFISPQRVIPYFKQVRHVSFRAD
jgi:hypothetical protein